MSCRLFQQTGTCRYGDQCKFAHIPSVQSKPSAAKKKRRRRVSAGTSTETNPRFYIQAFFNQYPLFDYSPSQPVMSEFYRMCDMFDWDNEDEEKKEARSGLKDALTQQFNEIYGEDENSLEAWQKLCVVLNVGNVPDELHACRNLVRSLFVNIVDLIDTPVTQEPVTHFPSEVALSEYTQETGKYFPKENAYAGGLLKFLLRQIVFPGQHRANRGRGRQRRN